MKAGVCIDNWKLPIFKRHLDAAGFQYTEHPTSIGIITLQVTCDYVHKLQPIVEAAQKECAEDERRFGQPHYGHDE